MLGVVGRQLGTILHGIVADIRKFKQVRGLGAAFHQTECCPEQASISGTLSSARKCLFILAAGQEGCCSRLSLQSCQGL